jgi:hypothetical protein
MFRWDKSDGNRQVGEIDSNFPLRFFDASIVENQDFFFNKTEYGSVTMFVNRLIFWFDISDDGKPPSYSSDKLCRSIVLYSITVVLRLHQFSHKCNARFHKHLDVTFFLRSSSICANLLIVYKPIFSAQ